MPLDTSRFGARQMRSRMALHAALERLIETTDLGAITVSALARAAGVGRPTFYRLYDDVDALLADRMSIDLAGQLDAAEREWRVHGASLVVMRTATTYALKAIAARPRLYAALLDGSGGSNAVTMFRAQIERLMVLLPGPSNAASTVPDDLRIGLIASALSGFLLAWIERDLQPSPEAAAPMMEALLRSAFWPGHGGASGSRDRGGDGGRGPSTADHGAAGAPRRITRRGIETRTRILDATVACLIRAGYAAMTVEEVMAEAGVSRGSVLHQFPTRIDLLVAVAERAMLDVLADARARAAAIGDPAERLADYARIVWEVHAQPQGLALTEILQAVRWDGELSDLIRPLAQRTERQVRDELIALASAAGVSDPARLVPRGWMLIAGARGLIIELGIDRGRPVIQAAVRELMESHRRYVATILAERTN